MLKKIILFSAALAFAVCANLERSYDIELNGNTVASGLSPKAAAHAQYTALLAAEEILPGAAVMPETVRHMRVGFGRPSEDGKALTDALLRSTQGVTVSDAVYAGAVRLGSVSDGDELVSRLREHILNTMPTWAIYGGLSDEIDIRRQYCRAGCDAKPDDMVQLVTGRVPVLYSDGKARLSRA